MLLDTETESKVRSDFTSFIFPRVEFSFVRKMLEKCQSILKRLKLEAQPRDLQVQSFEEKSLKILVRLLMSHKKNEPYVSLACEKFYSPLIIFTRHQKVSSKLC